MKGRNNQIIQSAFRLDAGDYNHQHINFPVLGIVLNVYVSDDPKNNTAKVRHDYRGYQHEADVLIVNDGRKSSWILPNVVVAPRGASGVDNYHEELPNGCSQFLDGSPFNINLKNVNLKLLDGDWAVISFIGGSIDQPYIQTWWPHPFNNLDPATGNASNQGHLQQGSRLFKRYQGLKCTITKQGSLFLDTNDSNSVIVPGSPPTRQTVNTGGDIQIDVKSTQQMEINFNPPVPLPTTQPSVPQANPPQGTNPRQDTATRMTLNSEIIDLIAAKVATLLSRTDKVQITSPTEIDATAPKVNLGDGALTALDNGVVLAQGIDTLTGISYGLLGNASDNVLAKK